METTEKQSKSTKSLCTSTVDQKIRKPNFHVTIEQKEFILNYMTDNPELISHSSTKENEKALWMELATKLNNMKPEKSLGNWKNFWLRWQTSVTSKPETILTQLDCQLKKFLAKVTHNSENVDENVSKTRYTVEEIENTIMEIEKEKRNLQLEVDEESISNYAINTNSTPAYSIRKEEFGLCPSGTSCSELSVDCLTCTLNQNCVYGTTYNANCTVLSQVDCVGKTNFVKPYICRYCYQTEHWEHDCYKKNSCSSVASPQQYYRTNCTVKSNILCLGKRKFLKNLPCNWTGGYRWSTALILSITLGGFGADRFYLGHWQEGIGKLFSFGGLGVWTLIDVMLISMRYLGPADGSLYI